MLEHLAKNSRVCRVNTVLMNDMEDNDITEERDLEEAQNISALRKKKASARPSPRKGPYRLAAPCDRLYYHWDMRDNLMRITGGAIFSAIRVQQRLALTW